MNGILAKEVLGASCCSLFGDPQMRWRAIAFNILSALGARFFFQAQISWKAEWFKRHVFEDERDFVVLEYRNESGMTMREEAAHKFSIQAFIVMHIAKLFFNLILNFTYDWLYEEKKEKRAPLSQVLISELVGYSSLYIFS